MWNVPDLNTTNNLLKLNLSRGILRRIRQYFYHKRYTQSSQINILSPNIGDEWHEQTDHDILWNSEGDIRGNEVFIGYA